MGKRHPNLPAWQWRQYPQNHQHPTNLALHMIAVPLFIIGFLLIVSGVFSLSLASLAVGVVGILAGWVMAIFANRWPDRLLQVVVLIFYSTPGFWIGLMAIVLFIVGAVVVNVLGLDVPSWAGWLALMGFPLGAYLEVHYTL